MEFTINSRKHGKISFWMNGNAGYVFLQSEGRPGQLGEQICEGGSFMGSTISANAENFEKVCRRWHKQHLAEIAEYDFGYYE